MYAEKKTRCRSKFCSNCGALIHIEVSDAQASLPEPCLDCKPFVYVIAAADDLIGKLTNRREVAIKNLDAIKKDRATVLAHLMLQN